MSMLPFLDHVEGCKQCRENPRFPCPRGYDLFQRGADRLVRKYDRTRAKA